MALLHILHSLLLLIIFVSLSAMISLHIYGHRIHLSSVRIRPFSLSIYGLSYSYAECISFSSQHTKIALQLPRTYDTTFLTVTLYGYEYYNSRHHVSLTRLQLEARLFPIVPETLINIVLYDFCVRIKTSQNTPSWLQTLRQNLIRTVLNGEHLRLDDFETKVTLCTDGIRGPTVTVPDDDDDKNYEIQTYGKYSAVSSKDENDKEAVATLNATEWLIQGAQKRLYRLGTVNAQLRRSWNPEHDHGTFVFIAKNASWALAPPQPLVPTDPRQPLPTPSYLHIPLYISTTLLSLPVALVKTIHDPASALTLHIPRLDVTFDRFRLRDAELVSQLWEFARRRYVILKEKEGMDLGGFLQDMVMAGILGDSRKVS